MKKYSSLNYTIFYGIIRLNIKYKCTDVKILKNESALRATTCLLKTPVVFIMKTNIICKVFYKVLPVCFVKPGRQTGCCPPAAQPISLLLRLYAYRKVKMRSLCSFI